MAVARAPTVPWLAMDAEIAYLFRHAVLRDAAYGLQLPGERSVLHELAFHLLEQAFGGRAPEPPSLELVPAPRFSNHATDAIAAELADHARQAGTMPDLQCLYLRRAAEHAMRCWSPAAVRMWHELAELHTGAARVQALRQAGAVAHRSGQPEQAEVALQQALECARQAANARVEIGVLSDLAGLWRTTGRIAQALDQSRQNLDALRRIGDHATALTVQGQVGLLLAASGRLAEARRELQLALQGQQQAGDEEDVATTLTNLCGVERELGHSAQAVAAGDRALALSRGPDSRPGLAIAMAQLSIACSANNDEGRAEQLIREALEHFRAMGDRRNCGKALSQVAAVCKRTGRDMEAMQAMEQALALAREQGERYEEAFGLCNLAALYLDAGRHEDARDAARQSVAIHRGLGSRRGEGLALIVLGEALDAGGDHSESERLLTESIEVMGAVGDRFARARAQASLADLHRRVGKLEQAGAGFDAALAAHREVGNRRFEGATMCDRALWLLCTGNPEQARQQWALGAARLRDCGDTAELQRKVESMRQACVECGVAPWDVPAP